MSMRLEYVCVSDTPFWVPTTMGCRTVSWPAFYMAPAGEEAIQVHFLDENGW
jgi:hypothetical protein